MTLGVGIAGCGGITQACHVPALASLPDLFRLVHCNDVDASVAETVAARLGGARTSSDFQQLLEDPAVEVVAVCTPDRFHADMVVAACEAGKRAVLCEKPLAGTVADADRIVAASAATGVPVLAATMHRYEPVIRAAEERLGDLFSRAGLVRSTMFVPPNSHLIDLATEVARAPAAPAAPPAPARDPATLYPLMPGAWASTVFVHHFPLLRMAFEGMPDRIHAQALEVAGARVTLGWGDRVAQLAGLLYDFDGMDWSFELWAPDAGLRVDFPPSFLAGRSAVARAWGRAGDLTEEVSLRDAHETGYRAEWRHLARVVAGEEAPLTPVAVARADVELAVLIGDAGRVQAS